MSWLERLWSAAPQPALPISEVRFGRTLEGLAKHLQRIHHPQLLDLGCACGANIDYFIRLGCKVHVDDYVAGLLSPERSRPVAARRAGARERSVSKQKKAVGRTRVPPVEHGANQFHAVLCWDLFDYLPREEARQVALEVARVTAPGGFVLGLFGPAKPGETRPPLRFRINGAGNVQAEEIKGPRLRPHHLANREILRLFSHFEISQTVLLKNGMREMLLQNRQRVEQVLDTPIISMV